MRITPKLGLGVPPNSLKWVRFAEKRFCILALPTILKNPHTTTDRSRLPSESVFWEDFVEFLCGWLRARHGEDASVEHVSHEVNEVGDVYRRFATTTINVSFIQARRLRATVEHIVHKVDQIGYVDSVTGVVVNVSADGWDAAASVRLTLPLMDRDLETADREAVGFMRQFHPFITEALPSTIKLERRLVFSYNRLC